MTRSESIRQTLQAQLSPAFLDIINESGQHSVPQGSETHFKVVVVSSAFDGKSQLARHRQVYALLDGELKTGMHALTVTRARRRVVDGGGQHPARVAGLPRRLEARLTAPSLRPQQAFTDHGQLANRSPS